VSIENGPASPGRWQTWHFTWRIGATSFVNVGMDVGGAEGGLGLRTEDCP
jgi:hypothetical protein